MDYCAAGVPVFRIGEHSAEAPCVRSNIYPPGEAIMASPFFKAAKGGAVRLREGACRGVEAIKKRSHHVTPLYVI